MATEFKLPDLGENIASGDVVTVFVSEGDVVKPGQALLEVETDKAVIEVPCPPGGRIAQVLVKKGDTVKVGQTLVLLDAVGAASAPAKPAPQALTQASTQAPPQAQSSSPAPTPAPKPVAAPAPVQPVAAAPVATAAVASSQRAAVAEPADAATTAVDPAGPAVRRLARELGVDLGRIRGSGPAGRIVREDVITAVRQAGGQGTATRSHATDSGSTERDDWGPVRREQLSRMRKTIATNMVRSVSTIPHLTNFDDADVTELEHLRKGSTQEYAKSNVKLTALGFVIKAVSLSLRQHPAVNASIDMEKGELVYKDYVNIGLAVDTPRGLVVPVLRNCDTLTIPQIAQAVTDTAEKAKNSQYGIEDLRGGTFTISNLGAIGGTYSTPIINWPEVAILLVGRSRKMPVVRDDRIEARLMMPLSLSYDHRVIDGAAAARFLKEIIGYLESPGRLLLAM
ncbi:MAG: dihydrolipoamide acetyltransferase family protein [Planctomycetia bacterium]|nr:dihydrolipoamide acetyltransferase family protein [Planctomycetia bacterium]